MARRRTGPSETVRELVYQRDGGQCARCGSAHLLTIHHRVNRGMGGAREAWINRPENLLMACTTCNGWFEDHPGESYEAGWKVRRPQRPDEVPVRYPGGRLYRLTRDGVRVMAVAVAR
ncbi:HNH endonuclease [Streptomyces boncukensis]|uniref:HNH endonuclease n=1 Tax=Streptomyces boncukensis TaxID=2711219 RepID=A0A6G4WR32_9ACTN|nr:HNH endonuclease signature motif containing protein [Streptomyces boncukensis]NGO67014.1 HNH endonuclease [Streptomyces boncukensis]